MRFRANARHVYILSDRVTYSFLIILIIVSGLSLRSQDTPETHLLHGPQYAQEVSNLQGWCLFGTHSRACPMPVTVVDGRAIRTFQPSKNPTKGAYLISK